jgi:TetR/AcrR family transcriptional repressor of nem operon
MRYDAEHKARTRQRVLKEAARSLRLHGPAHVAVADVMRGAGLTHGGFYAHFASKDDLLAHAVATMFEDAQASFERLTADKPPREALRDYIASYLSPRHCTGRDAGCPIAALGSDVPRLTGATRQAFEEGTALLAQGIAGLLAQLGTPDPGEASVSVLSELVGGLVLARLAADAAQAQALLAACRTQLLKRLQL